MAHYLKVLQREAIGTDKSRVELERDEVVTGYLIRDGVWAHLVSGERRCVVEPDREWIWHIELVAEDTLGRSLAAEGRMVSHQGKCGPTAGGPGNALFYWKWNGAEGWKGPRQRSLLEGRSV